MVLPKRTTRPGAKGLAPPPPPAKALPKANTFPVPPKRIFGRQNTAPFGRPKLTANKKPMKPKGKPEKSCLRKNWCWIVRIVLAIVGIAVPLYILFLKPCDGDVILTPITSVEQTLKYEQQAIDMFVILDASGSMDGEMWRLATEAAGVWVESFQTQNSSLQIGISQFADSSLMTYEMSFNVEGALNTLDGLEKDWGVGGSTYYEPALSLFQTKMQQHRQPNSFAIGLFISDGEAFDEYMHVADALKTDNVTIVGVMVGQGIASYAVQEMQAISSCDGYNKNTCPNFVETEDFQELVDQSEKLAQDVAQQVETWVDVENIETVSYVETVQCDPGLWWLCLLGLIPLLLLFLLSFCKRTKKTKVPKVPDVEAPKPGAPKIEPGKQLKKKYKWDTVATDHYLWNFQGGATKLGVNYGNKAPPSAPKDLSKGKIRREVEAWEEADGYDYIEEECTLEEWAEDKLAKAFCSWCCCCCCGSKK